MDRPRLDRILKILSPNDLGLTGSHQAGLCVPMSVAAFFPPLDSTLLNPDAWFSVTGPAAQSWQWRYIYYNSRLHGRGTRNEYRLTHVIDALRDLGAGVGDSLEFARDIDGQLSVRILGRGERGGGAEDVIEIRGSGRWFAATLPVR